MIRNEKLEDISDGRLYDANDMVKAYCNECKGCHACCTGMGSSIILDPLDVMRLCKETGKNFTQLLEKELEVNVVDLYIKNAGPFPHPAWKKKHRSFGSSLTE